MYLKAQKSRPTLLRIERIANFVSTPMSAMARVGQAVNNPVGFLKQYADRSKKLYEGDMIKGEVR